MYDLRNQILERAYGSRYSVNLGFTMMYHNLKDLFWWEGLKRDIVEFVSKCQNCEQVKAEHKKQSGLLKEIQVPTQKQEDINIDFVVGLPHTQKQKDSVWVVMDKLTKFTHFIQVKSTYSAEDYAMIFIVEIACRHSIPLSIISDRGTQFKYRFWRSFQKRFGRKVQLSTAFHARIDGQEEYTIQTL